MRTPPIPTIHAKAATAEHVSGGPLVAVLTLRAPIGTVIHGMPAPTLFTPVGLGVSITHGEATTTRGPAGVQREWQSTFSLGPKPRRLLVELSHLLVGGPLGPQTDGVVGEAPSIVRVLLTTPFGPVQSNPIEIRVRAANQRERDVLNRIRVKTGGAGGFGAWARSVPSQIDEPATQELFGDLSVLQFVRKWRSSRGAVAPMGLDVLPPGLGPEREAFMVEQKALRGEPFGGAAAAVCALDLGLDAWMDGLARGYSWTGAFGATIGRRT